MGLENLVWHEHKWPEGKQPETDNPQDEIKGRFDACENDQGEFFIWSAEEEKIVAYYDSRESVAREAQILADKSVA